MSEQFEEGAAADEVVDAVAEAPVEVAAPEAAAAPAFDWDDPRLTDLVDARAAAVSQQQLDALIREAQQQAQQQQGGQQAPAGFVDEFGNFDPSAFAQWQAQRDEQQQAWLDQRLQALAAPLAARQEAETVAEGEQRLTDILADDIARNGEFVSGTDEAALAADKQARQLVRTIADQMFPEVAQRYGQTARAAELAMSKAADQVRSLLKAAGATSVQQHVNHNATLAGASTSVGNGAGTAVVTLADQILSNRDLALKYSRDRATTV